MICLVTLSSLQPEDVVSSSELFSSLVNGRPVLLTANLTSVSNHFIAGGLIGTELDVTVSGERIPLVSGSSIFFPRLALHPVESSIVELDAEIQLELVDIFGQDSPFALTGISLLSVSAFYKQSMAANLQVIPDKILRLSRYRYSLSFASLATVSPVPFSQLLLDFFNSTELEVEIRCTCNVNVTTAMGNLTLTGVYLTQDLVLKGCGGLRDVEVNSIQVFSSLGGSLLFSAEGSFRNPSNASASLGAIALALERQGLRLGQVFSQSMSIGPGKNLMRVSGHLLPSSREVQPCPFHVPPLPLPVLVLTSCSTGKRRTWTSCGLLPPRGEGRPAACGAVSSKFRLGMAAAGGGEAFIQHSFPVACSQYQR